MPKNKTDMIDEQNEETIMPRDLTEGEMLESADPPSDMTEVQITVADIPTEAPNIIFVGEGDPPPAMNGVFKTVLPDAATQRAGFYHPQARQIIRLFSKQYKRYQRLGDV